MPADKAKAVMRALGGHGVRTVGFRPTWAMPCRWMHWSRRWWSVSVATTSWLWVQAGRRMRRRAADEQPGKALHASPHRCPNTQRDFVGGSKLEAFARACDCRESMEGRNVTETTVQSADLQRRHYRTLLGLSKAIATHRNLSDLLHDLAGHLHDLVDFRYLGVSRRDRSRHVMRLHILKTSEPVVRPFPAEILIEGSIAGWVWQHQQPFVRPTYNRRPATPP
jgi:hypothetical protein